LTILFINKNTESEMLLEGFGPKILLGTLAAKGRVEEQGAPSRVLEQPRSERLKQFLAGSLK
jgi:hypothetical protein